MVSTSPVKATIDDHIQQLMDALLLTLRRSALSHVNEIDSFLNKAMESLSSRPTTVAEIGEARKNHSELTAEKPKVLSCLSLSDWFQWMNCTLK